MMHASNLLKVSSISHQINDLMIDCKGLSGLMKSLISIEHLTSSFADDNDIEQRGTELSKFAERILQVRFTLSMWRIDYINITAHLFGIC